MLETVREYGLESLALSGELPALRAWHAHHYLDLALEAEPGLRGPDQAAWLDRLESEHDNLRAALAWSQSPEGDTELGLRLGGALSAFWHIRSHMDEGRRWLARCLQSAPAPSAARVGALAGAGFLAHLQNDARAARGYLDESLALAREYGDDWTAAWVLHLLGRTACFAADGATARARGAESRAIARAIGDQWLEGWCLHLLGLAAHTESAYAEGRRLYEESLAVRRALDYPEGIGINQLVLGMIDCGQEDYPGAWARLRESLTIMRTLDSHWIVGLLLANFAGLATALDQHERAARLAGAARAVSDAVRTRPTPLVAAVLGAVGRSGRRVLGDAAFEAAVVEGRRMSQEQAVAEAFAVELAPAETAAPEPADGEEAAQGTGRPAGSGMASGAGGAAAGGTVPGPDGAAGGGSAPGPGGIPGGLTARETDVLRLIAAGCTSQEIAERLVISIHTVERHITHIYQKLGVRGRAEAVAFAFTHGIG
jgi:non-specific serine/threonine protein kinase